MRTQLPDWVKNIVRKGEIAHNKQFLLFPQCFQSCEVLLHQDEYLWSEGLKQRIFGRKNCALYFLKKQKTLVYRNLRKANNQQFVLSCGIFRSFTLSPLSKRILRPGKLKNCLILPDIFISKLPFYVILTHSHTMTPFDAPGKQAFWKQCGKRRNCS